MEGIHIPVKISLHNRQRALPIRRGAFLRLAKTFARLAAPPDGPVEELAVMLVDDGQMPGYKAGCFGIRAQTDVVAQSYEAVPGIAPSSAELGINAERALAVGRRRAGGAARELALYLAHGMDHLAGHDDDTPARRRAMRRRETSWLDGCAERVAGIVGP